VRAGVGLLLRWVRGTEWRWFLDFATPAFFDVMPLGALTSQVKGIVRAAADGQAFRRARTDIQQELSAHGIEVRIVADDDDAWRAASSTEAAAGDSEVRRRVGQCALELYFGQLFAGEVSLLDLRAGRLVAAPDGGPPLWAPRSAWVRWDSDFLTAVRNLYAGFYRDDEARFAAGIAALGLEVAAPVLRDHFGAGDQRAVAFRTGDFRASFHEVFVRCRDAGKALHPGFVPLGIALACLYDGLEALDVPLDVRDAFERASG
jgi:hypothetical protein